MSWDETLYLMAIDFTISNIKYIFFKTLFSFKHIEMQHTRLLTSRFYFVNFKYALYILKITTLFALL